MANARGPKTNHEFFNTAAFVPQPTGTNGNEVRGSLFGPDFRHVDLSIFKDFPVTERVRLQFRAESFNISNTPSFIVSPEAAQLNLATHPSARFKTSTPTTRRDSTSLP